MSYQRPIPVPSGVTVEFHPHQLVVSGPLGMLRCPLPSGIAIAREPNGVTVRYHLGGRRARAMEGTYRAHLRNMFRGVREGFTERLVIEGVGYRVRQEGDELVFELGFSHPVRFRLPEGIRASVEKEKLTIAGIGRELVGRIAANIRSLRPPDAYKGKGIRYEREQLRLKPGKRAVSTAA